MKKMKVLIFLTFCLDIILVCNLLLCGPFGRERKGTDGYVSVFSDRTTKDMEIKKVAITFDDGPHPRYTKALLKGLKERGVAATFFVTGSNAEKYPELVKQMAEDGHLVGNHTYSHIQLTKNNKEQFKEELVHTNKAIEEILGYGTDFVRPPYGCWDKSLEEELNMFPVLWTIDPKDWNRRNASGITKSVIKKAEENDIILLHDSFQTSVEAALQIVDTLKEEGYKFVTVDEIIFD